MVVSDLILRPEPKLGPILVSHVGRRDSYELAYALTLSGRPVHLVTDFYFQPKTLMGKMAQIVFGASVAKRYRSDLNVTVHSSPLLLVLDLLERVLPRNKIVNQLRGYALGRKCLRVARRYRTTDSYFYYNSGAGHLLRARIPTRINLFQMHPHPDALLSIYKRYIAARPGLAKALGAQEEELTNNRTYFDLLAGEARLADRVVCTSSFVRQTLLDAGIPANKIVIVPYGTRQKSATLDVYKSSISAIRLAFIGQFVIRKGVHELVQFARNNPQAEVTVFSREAKEAQAVTKDWLGELPPNIAFRCILEDHLLWQKALTFDFLVLPSLAEGYGLVLAEAMAQGLPVIATRNSAASDLVVDGDNGFLMQDFFEQDIAFAVKRALDRKAAWPQIREAARAAAAPYSWAKFWQGILDLLPADDGYGGRRDT